MNGSEAVRRLDSSVIAGMASRVERNFSDRTVMAGPTALRLYWMKDPQIDESEPDDDPTTATDCSPAIGCAACGGFRADDRFGVALALCDYNSDGYDDLAVGAPDGTALGNPEVAGKVSRHSIAY